MHLLRRHNSSLYLLPLGLVLLLVCAGCAVGARGGLSSALDAQQEEAATQVLTSAFFGMVIQDADVPPAIPIGSRRLWDAGVTWAALEPQPGVFNWTTLDAEVAAAQQQGQQVTLTLGMTPAWASSCPSLPSDYGEGATAMPTSLATWDTYVTAVATRYAGRIAAYEVWSAPEDPRDWTGDPDAMGAAMAELAVHAAADVHAVDSQALLVSPPFSAAGLSGFLSAGGGAAVDVIAATLNLPGQAPEAITAPLAALRAAMNGTDAAGKPIWNEQGAWQLPESGLATDLQADYVARALLLNAGLGVQRLHWYAWNASAAGTLAMTDAQTQPTAAADAYAAVESWLNGAAMNGCSASASGLWSCQLIQNGEPAWVVWSPNGTVNASTFGAATETDLDGTNTDISRTESITVGAAPVLLR